MAIYHLSAKLIRRSQGDTVIEAAAYQARCKLTDEQNGQPHDYRSKARDVLFEGLYLPKGSPAWDRQRLWNEAERAEGRCDAQLARAFDIALPCELDAEQNRKALQDWVRESFTRKGLAADVALHAPPGRGGDRRNIHAHVLVTMRRLTGDGFAPVKETVCWQERSAALDALRERWERIGNRHLERYGFKPTLDRRSLAAQGVERLPTRHLGKAAAAMERRGAHSDKGNYNRTVTAESNSAPSGETCARAPESPSERIGPLMAVIQRPKADRPQNGCYSPAIAIPLASTATQKPAPHPALLRDAAATITTRA